MSLRVLIVDDEPLARRGVELRLQTQRDVEIVGQCSDGKEALRSIRELKPDLVFLDIQLPGMSGIDVLRSLAPEARPAVIFLTAFDEYTLAAFEVHAIDYLLKPAEDDRFQASLDHARRFIGRADRRAENDHLQQFLDLEAERNRSGPARQFAVRMGRHVRFVAVDDIDWVAAAGDYAELHVGEKTHLLRESLNTLEARLDQSVFLRIHRSTIVQINRIAQFAALPNRDGSVTLRNGVSLRVSRRYSRTLHDVLRNDHTRS